MNGNQEGSALDGTYIYGAAARADGSVVLTGVTYGNWAAILSGEDGVGDFMAVALDENGDELWRWQVL